MFDPPSWDWTTAYEHDEYGDWLDALYGSVITSDELDPIPDPLDCTIDAQEE